MSTTFTTPPFDGVPSSKPERTPKPLRVSLADRSAPPKPPTRHVPPKAAPPPVAYSADPPRDIAHAVELREALKASVNNLAAAMRGMKRTNPQRAALVAQYQATNFRLGEVSAWIRRERGAVSERFKEATIVRALLEVIDRAEEESGFELTPDERAAVDLGAEFLVHVEEQGDARKAVATGRVPSLEFVVREEGSDR